jgi:hypothetical protein
MATESKSTGGSAVEAAARRARSLNDRIVRSAKRGGEASLAAYENLLKTMADAQEAAGERSAEWISAVSKAQADFVREVADASPSAARKLGERISDAAGATARQARKVPGVAQAEGQFKGVVAEEGDLPIADYDDQNAAAIVARLGELSQIDLAKVDAYERGHANRKGVLDRVSALRGDEPWSGYDELNVEEVQKALSSADDKRVARVRDYERKHKARKQVLEAAEKELGSS